jgi:TRAP-type C4-dicarboxylate transport system substrate-binding protein
LKKLLFITFAAILALSVGLIGCTSPVTPPAEWDSEIVLDLHCTMPPNASLWEYVFQPWVELVESHNGTEGGNFTFDVTFGSEPWDEPVALEAISSGVSDVGQINGNQFNLGSIGYIPFLWNMEECAYATFELYNTQVDTWDTFGELDGVKVLITGPLQPAQWWSKSYNVTELADLSGLKIRAEDPEVATIEALNGTAVTGLEAGDLAGALTNDNIDGCFFTYSGGAFAFGLKDVCHYVTEVNLFPRIYLLAMNRDAYDALPDEAREWLDSCCTAQRCVDLAKAHDDAQLGAKGYIQNVPPKVPIYVLPGAELDNWKAATADLAAEWIADMDTLGFDGQGIYDEALDLIAATPAPTP